MGNEMLWDPSAARHVGDSPEARPGRKQRERCGHFVVRPMAPVRNSTDAQPNATPCFLDELTGGEEH